MAKLNMVQAINLALHQEMKRDDSVIVLGEDVGMDEGVFRVTAGLLAEFGDELSGPCVEDLGLQFATGLGGKINEESAMVVGTEAKEILLERDTFPVNSGAGSLGQLERDRLSRFGVHDRETGHGAAVGSDMEQSVAAAAEANEAVSVEWNLQTGDEFLFLEVVNLYPVGWA